MKRNKSILLWLAPAIILVACGAPTRKVIHTEYVLTTGLQNGTPVFLGVGDEINGVANPTLHAQPGETVHVVLINGGEGKHQIVFKGVNVKSGVVSEKGEHTSVTFTVPATALELEYEDGVQEFARLGMRGKLIVASAERPAPAAVEQPERALSAMQKGGCAACHKIPGLTGGGTIGPDLSEIGAVVKTRLEKGEYKGAATTVEQYLIESLQEPDAFVPPQCPSGPCTKGLMPASLAQALSQDELEAVVKYLAALPGGEAAAPTEAGAGESESAAPTGPAPTLTDEEFAWARQTYFERCAGCHGTLRKGATGPALTPDKMLPKGTAGLAAIIFNGTSRGMPDWGKQGFFTSQQTEIMAKFIQMEPPAPPELSLEQMKASWELIVPPDQRPIRPQTQRDWQNYFVVTLRDAGRWPSLMAIRMKSSVRWRAATPCTSPACRLRGVTPM